MVEVRIFVANTSAQVDPIIAFPIWLEVGIVSTLPSNFSLFTECAVLSNSHRGLLFRIKSRGPPCKFVYLLERDGANHLTARCY